MSVTVHSINLGEFLISHLIYTPHLFSFLSDLVCMHDFYFSIFCRNYKKEAKEIIGIRGPTTDSIGFRFRETLKS